MPVHFVIKRRPRRQHIGRIEVVAGLEHAGAAVLQTNFHLPGQNHDPLRVGGAVEGTGKTYRAVAQLEAAAGLQGAELGGGLALGQRDTFFAEFGKAVGVGKKDYFGEIGHGRY